MRGKVLDAERKRDELLQEVVMLGSVVQTTSQTAKLQTELFENKQDELKEVEAERIKLSKELEEVRDLLVTKMAIIDTLGRVKRRLEEERAELRNKLDQYLRPFGKEAPAFMPVTSEKAVAKPARIAARDIDLKGLVTDMDLKSSLAEISIGTADGVREGMMFYVTRRDEFICSIRITDADSERAIGKLELVEQQPKVGDNVSTNL